MKNDKPTVHYLPSTKQQTDKVLNQLLNIVEHLTAKEPDISPPGAGGNQNRAKKRVNIGLKFTRWQETQM